MMLFCIFSYYFMTWSWIITAMYVYLIKYANSLYHYLSAYKQEWIIVTFNVFGCISFFKWLFASKLIIYLITPFIHQTFLARHTHIRKNRPSLLGIKSSGLIHLIDESFYPFPTFSYFPYTRFPGQPVFYCRVLRLTFFLRFYIWVIPCGICLYLANFT